MRFALFPLLLFFTMAFGASLPQDVVKALPLPKPAPKWIVVDFWASWCGPCVASAPFYEQQSEKWKSHGVFFVGINEDDDAKAQQEWLGKHKISFAQVYDKDHALAHRLEVDALPRLMIFDAKQNLVKTVRGFHSGKFADSLEKDFADLFTQGETK